MLSFELLGSQRLDTAVTGHQSGGQGVEPRFVAQLERHDDLHLGAGLQRRNVNGRARVVRLGRRCDPGLGRGGLGGQGECSEHQGRYEFQPAHDNVQARQRRLRSRHRRPLQMGEYQVGKRGELHGRGLGLMNGMNFIKRRRAGCRRS